MSDLTQQDFSIRILVTGSRDLQRDHQPVVWQAILDDIEKFLDFCEESSEKSFRPTIVVVEGGCKSGADLYARDLVRAFSNVKEVDVISETHEVTREDWEQYGTAAGPIRNQRMVDAGASHCYAFFQEGSANKGTKNCVKLAEKALISTTLIQCEDKAQA